LLILWDDKNDDLVYNNDDLSIKLIHLKCNTSDKEKFCVNNLIKNGEMVVKAIQKLFPYEGVHSIYDNQMAHNS